MGSAALSVKDILKYHTEISDAGGDGAGTCSIFLMDLTCLMLFSAHVQELLNGSVLCCTL